MRVLRFLGIDRAVGYGLMSRFWGGLSALVMMALIAIKLSPVEQGFYYTMSSLLGIQIFFDMGLSNVITQFASHEFAHLLWGTRGMPVGDDIALSRLRNLLRTTTRWFGCMGILFGLLIIPAGVMFIAAGDKGGASVQWQAPWCLAALGAAFSFIALPFWSVIMGSGEVSLYNRRDLLSSVIASCAAWITMLAGGGLYAIATFFLATAFVSWFMLLRLKPALFSFMVHSDYVAGEASFSWRSEMLALQLKSAVTWVTGAVPFLMINPVLFRSWGAVEAGRMGMSLGFYNVLLGSTLTWMTVKTPLFCKLIAHGDRERLDDEFHKVLKKTIMITVLVTAACWVMVALLHMLPFIADRLITPKEFLLLFISLVLQVLISCYAIYLRAHKLEPLMVSTALGGIMLSAIVWWIGKTYGSKGILSGLCALQVMWGMPITYLIWRHVSRAWGTGKTSGRNERDNNS